MPNLITPGLQFDAETHRYSLAGCPLASVTQILKARGLIDDRWFTEEARERGSFVHQAIEYLNYGDLDWSSIPDEYRGYVDAWALFLADAGFEPCGAELALGSAVNGYAGTLDAYGLLNGKPALVEAKTGALAPWHFVQLAAYHDLLMDPVNAHALGLKPEDAPALHLTCQLKPDGTYALHPFGPRGLPYYRSRWRECLNLHHFCAASAT